jgi:hypothetical protein
VFFAQYTIDIKRKSTELPPKNNIKQPMEHIVLNRLHWNCKKIKNAAKGNNSTDRQIAN